MKKNDIIALIILLMFSVSAEAQKVLPENTNSADRLLKSDSKLTIGGYGQIDFNKPFSSDVHSVGNLDVHRLVLLFGYQFNERTRFITEIEFEHVKEVYVEQAFLQYKINNHINFRGGLMLVPMGLINEQHEPPTFNGVERPLVDKYISPTTWREIGFGFQGNLLAPSLKYQVYLMNGFNGFDGDPHLSGSNGLRKGRQKGAESFMSSPNFTFRVENYSLRGLSIGLSGYFGKTQSTLYDGMTKGDNTAMATYDSSRVGISMIGVDAKYSRSGFQFKGQFYYTSLSNTDQYNTFTADLGELNDLGSLMIGYYIEAGYNVFKGLESIDSELIPFVRYESYNTHHEVDGSITANKAYNKSAITAGLGLKLTPGAVLKMDVQFLNSEASNMYSKVFNAGIGLMF
jgi:hypothetical protein